MRSPPASVLAALATSGSERDHPPSIGTDALQGAITGWLARRFDVDVGADQVAAASVEGVRRDVAAVDAAALATTTRAPPGHGVPTYEIDMILAAAVPLPCRPPPTGAGLDAIDPRTRHGRCSVDEQPEKSRRRAQ